MNAPTHKTPTQKHQNKTAKHQRIDREIMSSGAPAGFQFPHFHNLPPFYTLQPVLTTREKQTQLWIDLIVQYCQYHGIYTLNIDECLSSSSSSPSSALFQNPSIQRKLTREALIHFLDQMVREGKAEYHSSGGGGDSSSSKHHQQQQKTHVDIYWKTPVQWADIILAWVNENGYNSSVLTVYEMLEGETGEGAEFYGMNPELFRKAIYVLNQRGAAELIHGSTSDADGVKFK